MEYHDEKVIISELSPIYDGRKSFYGKALVIHDREKGFITLRSYDTDVCMIDNFNKFHKLWDGWSATTGRHVAEFCKQYGFGNGGKKWWDSLTLTA